MKKILLILSIAFSMLNANANSEKKNINDIEKINSCVDAISVTSSDVLICENKGGVITLHANLSIEDSLALVASGAIFTWEVGGSPISGLINLDDKFIKVTVPSPTTTTTYTVRINPAPVNGCPNATGSILVTVKLVPTNANAGLSQIGSSTCGLSAVNLSADPVVLGHGIGIWSIDGDATGGSFGNVNNNNTTFTGTKDKLYTIRWTVTNAPCAASTDTAQIKLNQKPDDAFAGADRIDATTCGLTSVTLDANIPVNGTGKWTIISGTGGSFANDLNAKSTFNGVAGSTYVLRWTISKLPCADATDEVTIKFNKNPDVATANVDQIDINTCGLTTVNLAANTPNTGTGLWTIVSGTGGSFADDKNPNTGFSGIAGNTYTVRWTISNAPCSDSNDETNIKFNQNPTKALAGADQIDANTCGLSEVTLAANTPTIGTGLWTIVSGTGGSIADDKNPTSTFTGTLGVSYVLVWTISNSPCANSSDSVNVKLNQKPDDAFAGADRIDATTCGLTSVTLDANIPVIGTGKWTIISGTGGSFADDLDAKSVFNGIAGSTYVLRWTISNLPCADASDEVTIKFNNNPDVSSANVDQIDINTCGLTTVNLAANTPIVGTGLWTIVSGTGGSFTDDKNPNTGFSGIAGNTYTARWTISNAPCSDSNDETNITFNQDPTKANAGADQIDASTCGLSEVTLAANTPTIGTGVWTIVSGTGGSFADDKNPTSTFTGTPGVSYVLVWTISNLPCASSSDSVNVKLNQIPDKSFAGIDQTGISTCGKTSIQISGNIPIVGVGVWTIISGNGGVIVDKDAATTDLNGIEDSTYTVSWTITNAPCSASSDTITIKFNANPTKANAGPDQIDQVTCGKTTVSLDANIPIKGIGTWSYLSGDTTGISKNLFSNVPDPKSTFTGKAGKAYSLVWNITISPCGNSMDTVDILFNENPIASASNQNLCIIGGSASTNLGGNATNGTGVWSVVSGTGTLSDNTYSNTNETTSTLKWKVTGYCGVDSNLVEIRFRIKPNAPLIGGPDSVFLCSGRSLNLLATTTDTNVTFKWFNGSSEVIPSNNTLSLTVSDIGLYSITAYNINGCDNSSNAIKVVSRTSQKQNLNDTICIGVNYTVKPYTLKGNKYSWKYIDSSNVIGTDSFLVVNLNKRHVFVLSIIDSICGSLKPDTFFIDIFPQSEVRLTSLDSICLGSAVELTATITKQSAPKYKYTWYADSVYINGIFNDTANTKWVVPTKLSTKYQVVVEDSNGCFSSDEYLIKAVEWNLNEPNIFTPNNDGVNDAFYVNIAPNSTVAIEFYNRWGAQMYKSDNYSNDSPWTGDGASDGIYYFTMKPTCPNKTIKKWVQIAR